MGQPEWAALKSTRRKRKHLKDSDSESGSESEEEEEKELLQRTGNLLAGTVERLPGGSIDVRRMKDANSAKRAQAVVRAVEFHPSSSVILTAGYHKTLDLFQVPCTGGWGILWYTVMYCDVLGCMGYTVVYCDVLVFQVPYTVVYCDVL